ncbi:MAG: tRNA epoxyqueuosine(34) reductase QueG [Anaerolineales bacterium]|nr:tRNA epoxyqueuosine(34) reductase QueG [Anaerolineales bacterium]
MTQDLKQIVKDKARQLGFSLAGVTLPEPPPHYSTFEQWLAQGHHGNMHYLATDRARARRADPKQILPECKSILVLATAYHPPLPAGDREASRSEAEGGLGAALSLSKRVREKSELLIASYARGDDYHNILPTRMAELVRFIEEQIQRPIKNRYYTDTGPILERDLAQRAGVGWIGKNSCLINPKQGSYFFISEILLDLELEPDPPFVTDHCGTCTRCITACPTDCILPNRTLDATRCISYLTIELKEDIPIELREKIGAWVFGCDICQMVCPWNRFAPEGDPSFSDAPSTSLRALPPPTGELTLTPETFNRRFKRTPVSRAKRRGYLRNVAVAVGNTADMHALPVLQNTLNDDEPMIRKHAQWAIEQIEKRAKDQSTVSSLNHPIL